MDLYSIHNRRIPLALFSLRSCVALLARGAAYRKRKKQKKEGSNRTKKRLSRKRVEWNEVYRLYRRGCCFRRARPTLDPNPRGGLPITSHRLLTCVESIFPTRQWKTDRNLDLWSHSMSSAGPTSLNLKWGSVTRRSTSQSRQSMPKRLSKQTFPRRPE